MTTVLITGASDSLGQKARAHLEPMTDIRLQLFSYRNALNDPRMKRRSGPRTPVRGSKRDVRYRRMLGWMGKFPGWGW